MPFALPDRTPMPFDLAAYRQQVDEAVAALRPHLSTPAPRIGLILGTGLGRLADEISVTEAIPYDAIPHFPLSTVESHHGRLILGTLAGVLVIALQGRFHLYEGYDARQVTFPVRVLRLLGVETLLISNAAGGMNPHFRTASAPMKRRKRYSARVSRLGPATAT